MVNKIVSDWYLVAERFNFNIEALSYAIQDTKTLKKYMSLAHIRTGLNNGRIKQFGDAISILMNMKQSEVRLYTAKYSERVDISYLEMKAERVLECIQRDKDLTASETLAIAHAIDPIGLIIDMVLRKLVLENKYKEVK